ncbi:hypothetical protein GR223_20795 [Rhizobium leguminosarum]|uniref:hypothetical protein n=1 Tax=Rhizobium ruizarguesonis TaxID=2081791 RepID=UPI0013DECE0A|nr:hypothetical protein [Rhizobium ruizarguesonis]NEJ88365.1 hypothetical protein [Rhizobium ruizarguesonis]
MFHDVPVAAGLKKFDKAELVHQARCTLAPKRELVLADLSATGLRNHGVGLNELRGTEKDQYPLTRKWAEAIHAACLGVAGLCVALI